MGWRARWKHTVTPLRKRNSKYPSIAAAIEKRWASTRRTASNAEEFKRACGFQSKTQRLPGDYVIPPPPSETFEDNRQSAIERESQPLSIWRADAQNVPEGTPGL